MGPLRIKSSLATAFFLSYSNHSKSATSFRRLTLDADSGGVVVVDVVDVVVVVVVVLLESYGTSFVLKSGYW